MKIIRFSMIGDIIMFSFLNRIMFSFPFVDYCINLKDLCRDGERDIYNLKAKRKE